MIAPVLPEFKASSKSPALRTLAGMISVALPRRENKEDDSRHSAAGEVGTEEAGTCRGGGRGLGDGGDGGNQDGKRGSEACGGRQPGGGRGELGNESGIQGLDGFRLFHESIEVRTKELEENRQAGFVGESGGDLLRGAGIRFDPRREHVGIGHDGSDQSGGAGIDKFVHGPRHPQSGRTAGTWVEEWIHDGVVVGPERLHAFRVPQRLTEIPSSRAKAILTKRQASAAAASVA